MVSINQYTRQVSPQQLTGVQAGAASFGGDTSGLQAQASGLQAAASAAQQIGQQAAQVAQKRRSREDVVNSIRAEEAYKKELFNEYNRTQTEADLTDPKSSETFNEFVRTKGVEHLSKFTGSEDARVKLEGRFLGLEGQYTRQMEETSLGAQREIIFSQAGDRIKGLASRARANPADMSALFTEADELVSEIADGIYAEDEINLADAAQNAIVKSALDSYVDSGQYEEAETLINDFPMVVESLTQNQQQAFAKQISAGLSDKRRRVNETRNKIDSVKAAAAELGVEMDPADVYSAVTGINRKQKPQERVAEFAKLIGKDMTQLTPSIIAKIAYNADLSGVDKIDYNKEYTPDGALTPKGILKRVKEPYEKAVAASVYRGQILGAINLFREDGNKQALLQAMITFQKAIDDGAVVREGDIILQRSAQGVSDQISLWTKPGQIVGEGLVDEMEQTVISFIGKSLESSKLQIDPLLEEGDNLGYRRVNTIPKKVYDEIFAGITVKEPKNGPESYVPTQKDIEMTAKKHNMTVDQVKRRMGIK